MDVSTINYPALIGGLIALAAVIVAMLLKANLTKYTGAFSVKGPNFPSLINS